MPVLFFLVALVASIAGAISGIGGGILMKPVLELLTPYDTGVISFLSGCTVLSMAGVSLLMQKKSGGGELELGRGTALAVGSAAGGILGKAAFDLLGSTAGSGPLGAAQSVLLSVIVAGLLLYIWYEERLPKYNLQSGALCFAVGGGMGLLSSFLGIGGGPFNLAILAFLLSMDAKRASLHSLYIILVSQLANLAFTLLRGTVPDFPPALLACMVCGGVLGGVSGRTLSRRMTVRHVGRLYMAMLALVLLLSVGNLLTLMN